MNLRHILLLLCLMVVTTSFVNAQSYPNGSYYPKGYEFTPKGHMHCLIIFVTYGQTVIDPITNQPEFQAQFPTDAEGNPYPTYITSDAIPTWAMADGFITEDIDNVSIDRGNLSSYYRTMSFGEFDLTGQVVSVTSDGRSLDDDVYFIDKALMNLNNSDFDTRNCATGFSSADNILCYDPVTNINNCNGDIDYIAVIKKIPGAGDGLASNTNRSESGHWQKVGRDNRFTNMNTFVHEFAHNMYNAAHAVGANGVFHPHFNMQEGWGMVANPNFPFFTARANEMWVNGWLRDNPQDPQNNDIITVNPGNISNYSSGIELGDLLGTREAIRVEIPNSNPDPNEANHYLWIENHQKSHASGFDQDPEGLEDTEPGIYMYVTSKLNNFTETVTSGQSGNNVQTLHPYGKKDYTLNANRDGFIEGEDNPIAGLPVESYVRMNDPSHNSSSPDEIFHCINQNHGKCNVGSFNPKCEHPGDFIRKDDGGPSGLRVTNNFRSEFQYGDELSINGIHPVLNYPEYDDWNDVQEPFYLSGLKVEISSEVLVEDSENKYRIFISYDDWTFESDKRWCGTINLPGNKTLSLTNQSNLDLDLSGTANKSRWAKNRGGNVIKNFVDPTILTAKPGSTLLIENYSCLNAKEESTLKIEDGATLHLKTGGFIHVKDEDSKLVLDGGSTLTMEDDSYIEIKEGGALLINSNNINLNNISARIIIKAGGILTTDNNTAFDFEGMGNLIIEEGAIVDLPFNLSGEGRFHNVIYFTDDPATPDQSAFIDMEHDFYLSDCNVSYSNRSSITITDKKVGFTNVVFDPRADALNTSTAFTGNNLKSFSCKNSGFRNFVNGIVLDDYWAVSGNPNNPCDNPVQPTFKVEDSSFENMDEHAISCIDVFRLFANNNVLTNDAIGSIFQVGMYGEKSSFSLVNNSIENYTKGVHLDGVLINSSKYLYLSGGNISNCVAGIQTKNIKVDVKYCAHINNNDIGIQSTSEFYSRTLIIGRQGGTSIKDNNIGIKGVNMVVDIDAIDAMAANNGTHHPNDLSGNTVFFDLTYNPDSNAPTGLSARGNYWGWLNGCGASIHTFHSIPQETGSYSVPSDFDINDDNYLQYPPTLDCLHSQQICSGAVAPDSGGTAGTLNTNFNIIYNISNDYEEEEEYNNALFGYSLLADYEDEPVYNLLGLNDQNTVILSKIKEVAIPQESQVDVADCRVGGEDPSTLYPKVEIVEPTADEIKLIETVSPNPFTDAIQLVTVLKHTYKVEIFNAYRNLNGRAIKQLKTDNPILKIDLSDLRPGVYVIKVTDAEGRSDYREILKTD